MQKIIKISGNDEGTVEIYSRYWGKIFGINKITTKRECTRLQWWTKVSTMQGIIQRPGNDKGTVGNIF